MNTTSGETCYKCGRCFVFGEANYAANEYLPEGWPYKSTTFLCCLECGTQHAIEYANNDSGSSDRLRICASSINVPLMPLMRLRLQEVLSENKLWQTEVALQKKESDRLRAQLPHKGIRVNLLPKSKTELFRLHVLKFPWYVIWYAKRAQVITPMIFWMLYYFVSQAIWEAKHKPVKNLPARIRVTSESTKQERIQQLLENQRHFEERWPVVCGLPHGFAVPEGRSISEILLDSLQCFGCGQTQVLRTALPWQHFGKQICPCCHQWAVFADEDKPAVPSLAAGDIFVHEERRVIWHQQFSSYHPEPSERAIFQITNPEPAPYTHSYIRRASSPRERSNDFAVQPGHTLTVHLKVAQPAINFEEPTPDDTRLSFSSYEVAAIYDGDQALYEVA